MFCSYLSVLCVNFIQYFKKFHIQDYFPISPSLSGLRQMIKICEEYAIEYSIVFNPVKSKLICFNSVSPDKPYITLCDKPIDVVDNDLHLGNRIYNNIYTQCSNSMISDRHSNQVKARFRKCDSAIQAICILFL